MFPAFPAHAQPAFLRIWKEVHGKIYTADGNGILPRLQVKHGDFDTMYAHKLSRFEISMQKPKFLSKLCQFNLILKEPRHVFPKCFKILRLWVTSHPTTHTPSTAHPFHPRDSLAVYLYLNKLEFTFYVH